MIAPIGRSQHGQGDHLFALLSYRLDVRRELLLHTFTYINFIFGTTTGPFPNKSGSRVHCVQVTDGLVGCCWLVHPDVRRLRLRIWISRI
jgi:hypothetical protein